MGSTIVSTFDSNAALAAKKRGPIFFIYSAFLWTLSILEWGLFGYRSFVLHVGYPDNSTLFNPAIRFSDFTNFLPRTAHFGQANMLTRPDLGLPFPYPLPSILPFVALQHIGHNPVETFIIASLLCAFLAALLFSIALYRRCGPSFPIQLSIWSTLLVGFPGIFEIDRANIEIFIWALLALATAAFVARKPYLSASLIGFAASMKLYPGLMLLLFLRRKEYRAFVWGCVVLTGITLAMLELVGPGIGGALRDMAPTKDQLQHFQIFPLERSILRYDHSLFALWKQSLALYADKWKHQSQTTVNALWFEHSAGVYSSVAALLFAAIYGLRLRSMPLLNQFIGLLTCALLLPFVSYEYTLIHLYIAFALVLLALLEPTDVADKRIQLLRNILIILACTFAPAAVLGRQYLAGQIKCVYLIVLLGSVLAYPIQTTFLDGDDVNRHAADRPES